MLDPLLVAPGPLVDVAWLAAHAGDPRVRVVDCRWYLGGRRGADEYARGHIPGAVHLDVDADLSSPAHGGPGRHPLPDAAAFAHVLARIGVTPGSVVVGYDDAGGAIAARLWWLLRYFGHPGGRVLDGGLQAWTSAGHPLSTGAPTIAEAPAMDLAPGGAPVADKAAVDRLRRDSAAVILDARARERYEGQSEPVDARPGHIPGARSAPFVENLGAPGGAFRERAELERRYRDLGALDAHTVVCYCGSGVTACHDLLALATLGREDAILYEGSWSDWARDAALPAARGPEP
ncbi:thiosulfate sulfurtransferase [Sorangium cellulosum So ce56]|uniref:Thiosulfate sulfurtransferase n=1 Tax=Sorangium cellulosum (strain So ce56) TaxID=448385 RepID=A9GXE8_SORC5|nr:sulfurtransferase [Sorangium cellulosum]CAN97081.1 thiosulfate sulfurtransferase [Sorangium cellulosum So ce56]